MRTTIFIIGFYFVLISTVSAQKQGPFSDVARQTFADLLKVSIAYPDVDVIIHNSKEEEGLIIEDLFWESQDGKTVSAFVIRKSRVNGQLPAIICLHGSSASRDAMVTKQFGPGEWQRAGQDQSHTRLLGWARELARRGYLVLALTQRGLDTRKPSTTVEAKIQLVNGHTGMGVIVDEIRQGVTYLHNRSDVDSNRIGATGLSFGGITAFYLSLLDDRVAASASICGGVGSVDVFTRTGNVNYHGLYWWIPGIVAKGDQAWFASAMAPKPLMVWAPTEDVGMTKEAVDQFVSIVKPAYECTGKPSNFVVYQQPGIHSFTMEAFEAMVNFFDAHFK
ncbi:MAG: dienelactone hydrolase family protein [Bacteroidales bacterium]|nr:dienelactone hydrolase family protein [Bacteroidales bacterium]